MNFTRFSQLGAAILCLVWASACQADTSKAAANAAPATPDSHTAPVQARLLPLEGGRNFRDLGGYRTTDGKQVKWGKLYRSGVLTGLTDSDYTYLANRNIEAIVDFRSTSERKEEPTYWRTGEPQVYSWDYDLDVDMTEFTEMLGDPEFSVEKFDAMMTEMYPGLAESQKPHYRAMFSELVDDDKPVLFHCSAGKDRTGVAAALILTALGVDRETVIADYELSEQYLDPGEFFDKLENPTSEQQAMAAFYERMPESMKGIILRTRGPYLEAVFATMESQSGSVLGYIQKELLVSDEQLAILRAYYLE